MSGARQLINPYPEYTEEPSEVISSQREAKTRRMPATLKIFLVAACCVVVSVLYLQQQITSYHLNVELGYLQQQVKELEQQNDYLMLHLEAERSLPKIEEIARRELGMIDPELSISLVVDQLQEVDSDGQGRWLAQESSADSPGFLASLTTWLNKAFPLGGVEAGTLRRK
ncbi:MAG: hypothetical protein GX101_03650 [Firmicutes bacterium]|jgi:cell division protein FtsL|nr:cell division protein FtsL [Bacillota bacterium]NLO65767.1 hypothetical protein [Bacillota bacterium]